MLGGGIYYASTDDVLAILHAIHKQLAKPRKDKLGPPLRSELRVRKLGKFHAAPGPRFVDQELLLGALDYFSVENVDAYQIVPERDHLTIDVPDMTKAMSAEREPLWHLDDVWPDRVAPDAES